MFTATRLTVLSAALAAAGALVFGVAASGASAPWPSCLGQPATIVGTDGNDTITGTPGDDVIAALGGDDTITSGGTEDYGDLICAGDGNDTVIVNGGGYYNYADVEGGAGDDRIQGSKGSEVEADYEISPSPVTVNLGAGTATGWGNDTLVNVSSVWGSKFDDTLIGSARSDGLWGDAGNDTINGLANMDDLGGGPGNDKLDGGTGPDLVDYFDAPSGVHVNLAKGVASGGAGHDTLRSFEAAWGSKHADVIVGNAGANYLFGNSGNDSLYGGLGRDTLDGNAGKDRADGGPARDVCRAERKVHCP
ncbi:MAG TPA: calcium-binding protein [Gaiellaceae bacterium]|nr:calcium-binding protein [Gaiellaceae bacterium]